VGKGVGQYMQSNPQPMQCIGFIRVYDAQGNHIMGNKTIGCTKNFFGKWDIVGCTCLLSCISGQKMERYPNNMIVINFEVREIEGLMGRTYPAIHAAILKPDKP